MGLFDSMSGATPIIGATNTMTAPASMLKYGFDNRMGAGKGLKDVITGRIFSEDEDAAAQDYLNKILAGYDNVKLPDYSNTQLEKYQVLPGSAPELINAGPDIQARLVEAQQADAIDQGPSAMEGIALDPALRQQQMASLDALKDLAANGGMTAADKANLSRIQNDVAAADRGRREAIRQNMASRGMGGSGMDLLAQLQSNQAATDRAAQQGLDVAGMAEQRALDAMTRSGQMAGSLRDQDFGQASQVAQAQDAISRFNAANRNQFAQFNANQRAAAMQQNANAQMGMDRYNRENNMQAQQFNANAKNQFTNMKQNLANQNVDLANRQKIDLPQQAFQNQMAIANGRAGANQKGMDYYTNMGMQNRQAIQGAINEGIKGGTKAFMGGV